MDPVTLTQTLKDGGPWAIAGLCIVAMIYLWNAYVKIRDRNDEVFRALNTQNMTAQIELTKHVERQAASNENVASALENLERRLENVERSKSGPSIRDT